MSLKSVLNRIALSFQPAANRIRAWDLPPDVKALFDETWDRLPKAMKKHAWKLLLEMYKNYGEMKAKQLLADFLVLVRKTFA